MGRVAITDEPAENGEDLRTHAEDFAARTGFTYTVLSPQDGDVIGCVYIYPDREGEDQALVRSWVRSSHAHLDEPLWRAVSAWLSSDWPFERVRYAPRDFAANGPLRPSETDV